MLQGWNIGIMEHWKTKESKVLVNDYLLLKS